MIENTGAYYLLWDIIVNFVYGANAVLTSEQQLVLTLFCTAGALFCISVPFILVYKFIRMVCG